MKLKVIKDMDKFFKCVDKCKGSVKLVSKEGDCLNLTSKLTQYLAMTSVFQDDEMMNHLDLQVSFVEDVELLSEFIK